MISYKGTASHKLGVKGPTTALSPSSRGSGVFLGHISSLVHPKGNTKCDIHASLCPHRAGTKIFSEWSCRRGTCSQPLLKEICVEEAEGTLSVAPGRRGVTNAQNGAADPQGCVDKPCPAIPGLSKCKQHVELGCAGGMSLAYH